MKADEREMMRPGGVRFVTAAKMDESCEKIIIGIIFPSISVASIKVKVCQRDPSTGSKPVCTMDLTFSFS